MDEPHLLPGTRYTELNPVKAGIVNDRGSYTGVVRRLIRPERTMACLLLPRRRTWRRIGNDFSLGMWTKNTPGGCNGMSVGIGPWEACVSSTGSKTCSAGCYGRAKQEEKQNTWK